MRLTWLAVPVLLIGLVGCTRQVPPERARVILQQVQEARRTLSLQGKLTTSIQLQGQQLEAEAEIHRAPGVVLLKYTSGRFAGWQIIEQDGYVWRVSPEGKASPSPVGPDAGLGLPPLPGRGRRDAGTVDLRVKYAGLVRTAGRRAHRYVIQPPQKEGARLAVAIDAETSFPLATQRYGPGGKLVSETVYREIQYNTPPPQRVQPPAIATQRGPGKLAQGVKQTTEQELERMLGGPLLKPAYVPPGLHLRGFHARQMRRGALAEMRYSDGLRTLVVGQAKVPQRPAGQRPEVRPGQRGRPKSGVAPPGAGARPEGRQGGWWQRFRQEDAGRSPGTAGRGQRGAMGRNMLRERRGERMVIVAGDLPQQELRKVIDSVPYPAGQKSGTKF